MSLNPLINFRGTVEITSSPTFVGFFVYKRETHIIHTNTKVTLTQFIGLVCKIFSEIFKIGTGFYGK